MMKHKGNLPTNIIWQMLHHNVKLKENIDKNSRLYICAILLVGGGAKEEHQRLNFSGTLCRPSIRPITIFHRFFFFLFYSD